MSLTSIFTVSSFIMFVFADTLSLQFLIVQKQFGLFSSNISYYSKVDYLRDGYIFVGATELFQVLICCS